MRKKLSLALVLAAAGLEGAQNPLEEMLRKAVVQEETNQNLEAAIQGYQAVLAQFGEERKTAATALFRLAETYRKQGKNEQAIAAYERLVREFSDQAKLTEQSRKALAETFNIQPRGAPGSASERDRAVAELEAAYAVRKRELDEQRELAALDAASPPPAKSAQPRQ